MFNTLAARCVQLSLAWWVLAQTNDTTAFSVFVMVAAGTDILARGFLGWLGDAYSRRLLIGMCYCVGLLVTLGVALLVSFDVYSPVLLLLCQACLGLVVGVREPTQGSIVPALVSQDQLSDAIRWRSSALTITSFCSPILATLLISGFGADGGLWCSTVLVLASLLVLGFVKQSTAPLCVAGSHAPRWQGGFTAIRRLPPERSLVKATFLINLGLYPFFGLLLPAYFQQHFEHYPWLLGIAEGAFALGLFLGASPLGVFANGCLGRSRSTLLGYMILGVGVFVAGVCCQVLSLDRVWYFVPFFLALAVAGCGLGISATNTGFLRAAATPDRFRNRVGAASAFGTGLANPMGVVLAGSVAAMVGPAQALLILGAILMLASVLALLSSSLRAVLALPDEQMHGAYSRLYPDAFSKEVNNATA